MYTLHTRGISILGDTSSAHTPIRSRAMSICARSGSSNCLIPFGFTQNFVALLQFVEKKNVVLTFWPTKPKSNQKGQKIQNTTNTGKDHKTLTRKNVALITFWLKNQKLPNLKPKPRTRKGQKSRKKAAILVTTKLYCPAAIWQEKKCCCFNILNKEPNSGSKLDTKKDTIIPKLCCPALFWREKYVASTFWP